MKNLKGSWNLLGLLGVVAFLGGCTLVFGGGMLKKPENDIKKAMLAYGYFDLDDAPGHAIDWLELLRFESGKAPEYWSFGSPGDGLVVQSTFKPGSYKWSGMSVRSGLKLWIVCFCGWTKLDFGQIEGGFKVPPGDTFYVGAWRYIDKSTFFHKKFDLERIKDMSERDVLEKLIPKLDSEAAVAKAKARLKELR